MGLFDFLKGNYKPADFKDKSPEQIFKDVKLDKVEQSIKNDAEYENLSEETKSAIDFLLDLREGKNKVFEKCYKKKNDKPGSFNRPASMPKPSGSMPRPPGSLPRQNVNPVKLPAAPAHAAPAAAPPAKAPIAAEVNEEESEGQEGGRKRKTRRRKGKKSKKNRRHKTRK
jgi:hypothetical protein